MPHVPLRKFAIVILAAIGTIGGALILGAVSRDDQIDWNPFVRKAEDLEGSWVTESTWLKVEDGEYQCKGNNCGALGTTGAWEREGDFYVRAGPRSKEPQLLRLGVREGKLVIAAGAGPGDPDLWNPSVKFTRVKPWNY